MDLRHILDILHNQQQGIEKAIQALESLGGSSTRQGGSVFPMPIRRRPMSAASRKQLSESMKRRWAIRKARARAA